jgi:hypothetical protein
MIWQELALVLASIFGAGLIAWVGVGCGRTVATAFRIGEVPARWMWAGIVKRQRSPTQFWLWVAHHAFGAMICAYAALLLMLVLVVQIGLYMKGAA